MDTVAQFVIPEQPHAGAMVLEHGVIYAIWLVPIACHLSQRPG